MTALEAKQDIIQWITGLEDESSLKQVLLLKTKLNRPILDWWDEISQDEKTAIDRGLDDIKNGRVYSHQEVRKLYEQWL